MTPDNGVRPVGRVVVLATADGALPAGLKEDDGCCKNGSTGGAGWDENVDAAGAGAEGGAVSNNARKVFMPASWSGVGLGGGSGEPKGLAQMLLATGSLPVARFGVGAINGVGFAPKLETSCERSDASLSKGPLPSGSWNTPAAEESLFQR